MPSMRRLSGRDFLAVLAVLAVIMLGASAGTAARPAAAQLATPPARIFGVANAFGRPVPPGSVVVAFVGFSACGSGSAGLGGAYQVDVRSAASQPGCGIDGAIVTFTVDGRPARETVVYQAGAFIQRDLSVAALLAQITVERWAPYAEEPCASPQGPWCIQTFPLPPATEPFARYRMLAFHRDGRVTQATGWIDVVPFVATASVPITRERGVVGVLWERWAPLGTVPCGGRVESVWCVEAVAVPPPITGTVWYRLLVTRPDGATDDPTGFIPAAP